MRAALIHIVMEDNDRYLLILMVLFLCMFIEEIKCFIRVCRGLPDPVMTKYSAVPV